METRCLACRPPLYGRSNNAVAHKADFRVGNALFHIGKNRIGNRGHVAAGRINHWHIHVVHREKRAVETHFDQSREFVHVQMRNIGPAEEDKHVQTQHEQIGLRAGFAVETAHFHPFVKTRHHRFVFAFVDYQKFHIMTRGNLQVRDIHEHRFGSPGEHLINNMQYLHFLFKAVNMRKNTNKSRANQNLFCICRA